MKTMITFMMKGLMIMRWFDKQRFNSLWVCGFSIVLLMGVLCCPAFAEDKTVMVKRIVVAHEKALASYKAKKITAIGASFMLSESGIDKIIDKKPDEMNDFEYVSILNDYGYYLLNSDDNNDLDKSIKCLKHVIAISPNTVSAYLNLGDALFTKLRYVYSFNEKIIIAQEIDNLYRHYKQTTDEKIDRVDAFIDHNISHDKSNNICDYITINANNGIFMQMVSTIDDVEPVLCDVNMDGKTEYLIKEVQGRVRQTLKIKQRLSDKWIECDAIEKTNINTNKYLNEGDWQLYPKVSLIPYKDGIYYVRYAGFDYAPYIAAILKIKMDRRDYVCIYKNSNIEHIDICKSNRICDYISNNKIKYLRNTDKYTNITEVHKLIKHKFQYYDEEIDYNAFIIDSNIYIDVKSLNYLKPFHEVWRINKGKKDVICSYEFKIIHVPLYNWSTK